MRRGALSILIFLAMLSAATPSMALMRVVRFEDMAAEAADVVEATVERQKSFWSDDGHTIYTDVLLRVRQPVAGPMKQGQFVQVRVEGGVVGDVGIAVEHQPVFRSGERVVLFLRAGERDEPRAVLHLEQGTFRVSGKAVVDFRGERRERSIFLDRVRSLASRSAR